MDKKKILIVCSILIILVSIIASIYIVSSKEEEPEFTIDGINLPENKEVLKDATVEDLKITDVSLMSRDETSTFKATVSNDTDKDITIDKLYIIFYEEKKETKAMALYNTTVESNEETYINITLEKELTKVTKIEYVLE